MIRIAVCDDEADIRTYLCRLIRRASPDNLIEEYTTAESLLNSEKTYDIVFLDIRMDGMDGLAAAERLRSRPAGNETILIFVTALEEYVFRAFDVGAFHYLLKPIDPDKFERVFARAVDECNVHQKRNYLFIHTRNMHRVLPQDAIYYIESAKRKVVIYTQDEHIETYATMDELGAQLGENFFRCHRGFFVNLAMIEEYDKSEIQLKNGMAVLLAKQKYKGFIQSYMHYLQNAAR